MAVTTTYSITSAGVATTIPFDDSLSDTVGLKNGGFATQGTHGGTHIDATFYDAQGNVTGSPILISGTDGAIGQLKNGNVVITSTDAAGGIDYSIFTTTGTAVTTGLIGNSNESNSDVAALKNGKFVVVDQEVFSGTDHDIEVHIRNASGHQVVNFSVDSSLADDEAPSVVALSGGGFAVAWERNDGSGNTSMWTAVYDNSGATIQGPTQVDAIGSINSHANLAASKDGGFTLSYADNGWDNTQPDVTVAAFSANGTFEDWNRASSLSTDDSAPAVTVLSNGLAVTSFTNVFSGSDTDILASVVDTTTGTVLTDPSNPLHIAYSGDTELDSSISALTMSQFIATYTDATTGTVHENTYQLVRTSIGDSANDTITGDDAVDIIDGGDGNDNLGGGGNNDIINGGNGSDHITGGSGQDTLTGGALQDFFNFNKTTDSLNNARDTITDFQVGIDKINLHSIDANSNTVGDDAFTFIGNSAFTGVAGQLNYSFNGTTTVVHGDVNGDGVADFGIVLNGGHLSLSATDFVL